jgi:predicted Zn-dependent protease
VIARVLCVLIAVVACAWFVLGIRQANDLSAAQSIVNSSSRPTPAQAARATSLLKRAGTLNPDASVQITQAQLLIEDSELSAARGVLAPVVAREPDNVQVWAVFARAAYGTEQAQTAINALVKLDPLEFVHH